MAEFEIKVTSDPEWMEIFQEHQTDPIPIRAVFAFFLEGLERNQYDPTNSYDPDDYGCPEWQLNSLAENLYHIEGLYNESREDKEKREQTELSELKRLKAKFNPLRGIDRPKTWPGKINGLNWDDVLSIVESTDDIDELTRTFGVKADVIRRVLLYPYTVST